MQNYLQLQNKTHYFMSVNQKIIAIHQPNYFPWIGYFYKIYQCDIFVFHDDVQFSKKGMHNYLYIKTKDERLRLKIPVIEHQGTLINEVIIKNNLNWKHEHLHRIKDSYFKAPYFSEIFSDIENLLSNEESNLALFNVEIICFICAKFGFMREFVNASELNLKSVGSEKVLDINSALGASIYYSGTGALAYQNDDDFNARGIELKYSNYEPFEYPQFWGEFDSNVSILDYLMHCGYDWERVLKSQSSK